MFRNVALSTEMLRRTRGIKELGGEKRRVQEPDRPEPVGQSLRDFSVGITLDAR